MLKRFFSMSDTERARVLVRVMAVIIIVLLYSLGAFSLYLRSHYLNPEKMAVSPTPLVLPTSAWEGETVTPTLYPTLTPKPEGS